MKTSVLSVAQNIELRTPRMEDATAFFTIVHTHRDDLQTWLPWVTKITSLQASEAYIYDAIRFNEGEQRIQFFVFYKNKLAGGVAFVRVDKVHRKAEMGYWLSPEVQGKGIIIPALEALIELGFERLHLHRLYMSIAINNTKSLAVPKRLHFKYEGCLRDDFYVNGVFHDMKLYSLVEGEPYKGLRTK